MERELVKVFRALGDPNRIRIIKMLEVRELCVCEVREILDLSNSTVSKHLSILYDAGLITQSKDGKWVNYALNSSSENNLVSVLLSLLKTSLVDDDSIRKDLDRVRGVDRNTICQV